MRRHTREIVTDFRIWGTTCLLVGWPAFGILLGTEFALELAMPIVYVYLFVLHAVVRDFPGFYAFWVGFALFCFSIATVFVSTFDWVRIRRGSYQHSERKLPIKE